MSFEQPTHGDFEKGYYGTVNGMITNSALSTAMNITVGTLLDGANTDITFHKFIHMGRILYIPNRPIRHSISWDQIQTQNGVKGKVITIGDKKYLCRLLTGSRHYYTNNTSIAGGEWNDTFLHFHNLGILTAEQVYVSGNGRATWTQEVHSSSILSRVFRGLDSVAGFSNVTATTTSSSRGWRPVLEELPEMEEPPQGTTQAGFYGEVTGIITANDLRTATGVTQGTAMQTGDITWLKFAHQHKTLFIAKQPIQHSISWDHLNEKGVISSFSVGGGKILEINGIFYLVRLMQGSNINPGPDYNAVDSPSGTTGINNEWDNLIIPVHGAGGWAQYTNQQLNVGSSSTGNANFCQEAHQFGTNVAVARGYRSIGDYGYYYINLASTVRGWRPVLEVLSSESLILYHLLKSNGVYYSYQNGEFIQVPATQESFENYGVDLQELVTTTDKAVKDFVLQGDLGAGKLYKVEVDPKIYKGIKSMKIL
jgi:hypothetical protein